MEDLEETTERIIAARLELQAMLAFVDEMFPEDWQLPAKRDAQHDVERGFR